MMRQYIASTARAVRKEKGYSHAHIAAARGVRESTVVRFEGGKQSRVDIDQMLDAYAAVTGVAPITFWDRALAAWHASDTDGSTDRRGHGSNTDHAHRERQRAAERA